MRREPAGARLFQVFLRRYARREAQAVAPFVLGPRVLDLGAGEAYVAEALRELGPASICSTDVGVFARTPGPYVAYDGWRLPFPDGGFDSTLILLTLHHCSAPEAVLDAALRVTRRRLIVMESVYRSRMERFWLELLDGRLNGLRHCGRMGVAERFRTGDEWQALFESRGLRVVETRWPGAWWERLVHHPLLFVLDKRPAGVLDSRGGTAWTATPRGSCSSSCGVATRRPSRR